MDDQLLEFAWKVIPGLIGVYVGRHFSRQKDKSSLALDLYKEFASEEAVKKKGAATQAIINAKNRNDFDNKGFTRDEVLCIFYISQFYERVAIYLKYEQVNRRMIIELFCEEFYYHYYGYLIHFMTKSVNGEEPLFKDTEKSSLAEWFESSLPTSKHVELIRHYNLD